MCDERRVLSSFVDYLAVPSLLLDFIFNVKFQFEKDLMFMQYVEVYITIRVSIVSFCEKEDSQVFTISNFFKQ